MPSAQRVDVVFGAQIALGHAWQSCFQLALSRTMLVADRPVPPSPRGSPRTQCYVFVTYRNLSFLIESGFYFASADDKATFDKSPANYARSTAVISPTGIYKGKLYLCESPKAEKTFHSKRDANIRKADANWRTYEPPSNPGFNRELGS
jgi:hypothetical protein